MVVTWVIAFFEESLEDAPSSNLRFEQDEDFSSRRYPRIWFDPSSLKRDAIRN